MKRRAVTWRSRPPCRSPQVTRAIEYRLRRLKGQASGIERMLREQRSCDEVLTQIAALKQAGNGLAAELLAAHIACCLGSGGADSDDEDAIEGIRLAVRSVLKHA